MEAHAPQRLDPMDLPSGTHVGHWCVIGRLGWGGYGAVYLVRSLRGRRRQAALKLALRPGAVARRLAREAELLDTFPFESEGEVGSYRAHLEGRRPADPAALNPRVPQAVSDLVLRLLSPRPEERPASAREVAEQVDTLVRSGGSELEAPLFERKEGASPHSRTTEAARAPHPLLRLPVSFMEALGALSRRWLPGLGTALVVGAVLMAVFASGLAIRGLPFTPSYPTQEGATVDEPKSLAGSSPAPEAKLSPLEFDFMKSLAMAVCLVSTGCAGVPVNPTWPRDCPPETLAVMKLMGFEPGDQAYIVLDINQPGALSEHGVYQAGPIVSVFTEEEPSRLLPVGTKVYGHMWTGGEQTQVYWTRAEMPDGREMPLCAVLGFDERGGYWKKPGPQPGTVIVSKQAPLTVTRRFERPE